MSHKTIQPHQPFSDKSGYLEGRLTNQERTMATLLEQAFQIKEDVVASLRATQGSVHMEASARRLLENHVQTITHIVKQLSKGTEVLEAQIVQRDSITSGTTFAVQSLDHKNLAGIGDLRGRVARCDSSIAKLSGDVGAGGRDILALQREVAEIRSSLELRLRDMELKLSRTLGRLESTQSERLLSQKSTSGDLRREIQHLDVKTSSGLKELEEGVARLRKWTEQQLCSSAQTHVQGSEQLQERMVEAEGRLREQVVLLSGRVERVEERLEQEGAADGIKRSESKLSARMVAVETSLREELDLIRKECQSGFQSIRDAIDSLRHIGDTKARLDKGQLQKDIRQIRRKMVELKDV